MIKASQVIKLKKEFMDVGDNLIEMIAIEDEDSGRVRIMYNIPHMSIKPTSIVKVSMIEA